MRALLSLCLLTLACSSSSAGAPTTTSEPPRPTVAAPTPTLVPSDCVCGTEPGCPPCPAPTASASATAPIPAAPGSFPPKAFAPPFEKTKKPGDGEWRPLPVHRASSDTSPMFRAIVHPHKFRSDAVLELVAIDTSRASMDLILGTKEPEDTKFPADKRPGLVPASEQEGLIAITNGGFKSRHGGHGVGAFGEVVLAPSKPEHCTFAKAKDGRYLIGTYSRLQTELGGGFAWFRGTPPCLIEDGVKHPDLGSDFGSKKWGRAEDGKRDIRRSAVGLGADGRTLYFAIGDWLEPEWLADGLAAAGITRAAELDINWSYTRFIVYERAGGELVATSPLLKELKAPKKEYVKEASERDFFAIRWR